jgi:hypothetical protein
MAARNMSGILRRSRPNVKANHHEVLHWPIASRLGPGDSVTFHVSQRQTVRQDARARRFLPRIRAILSPGHFSFLDAILNPV